MIGVATKIAVDTRPVLNAVSDAAFRNMPHAAASIRKTAIAIVERSPDPSPAGTPIHTRRGLMDRAIQFFYDKEQQAAYIGPVASIADQVGAVHEFGGEYKGADYPERSFMGPALTANEKRFASEWEGSIGG